MSSLFLSLPQEFFPHFPNRLTDQAISSNHPANISLCCFYVSFAFFPVTTLVLASV